MKQNIHGELIFNSQDLCDLVLQGHDLVKFDPMNVDDSVDLETAALILQDVPTFVRYNSMVENMPTEVFDHRNQQQWFMPSSYKQLDIAEHVLSLCTNDAELQRCGQELMMYQERDLFDLLRYLKFLVDTMHSNRLIWGVGRGSSVASYVLFKLGVHRIDSLYYDLDPSEFLR